MKKVREIYKSTHTEGIIRGRGDEFDKNQNDL